MTDLQDKKGIQIATQAEFKRERELLAGLGLSPIKHWATRCKWYKPDGSFHAELPSDMYSRLLYMGRGLRPEIGIPSRKVVENASVTLLDAVVNLMDGVATWRGTASDLLSVLDGKTGELPVDGTRLSKRLNKLASQLLAMGIVMERVKSAKKREILLERH